MHSIDGFVFDLDGTVYLGDAALPGSVACIQALRARGKQTLFVTNKPLDPPETYAAKLTNLGIPTSPNEIITSAFVLGTQLAVQYPSLRYYLIGEEKLKVELRQHGLIILDELFDQDYKQVLDVTTIDAVIVAFDRTFSYRKLNTAYQALRRGAHFFATNADKTCPLPGGSIPDAGATLAALAHITGRTPDLLAGKPSTLIVEVAMAKLGLPAARCLMIGDRLETDILMGQQAGMKTALVLTGVATRAEAGQMAQRPDLVLENLSELTALIE